MSTRAERKPQTTKNPRAAPEGDGLVNIPIEVKKKLLALAPGAEGSRCGPLVLQKGTCGGADGVSISQAHEVRASGRGCSLARLNDPPTVR